MTRTCSLSIVEESLWQKMLGNFTAPLKFVLGTVLPFALAIALILFVIFAIAGFAWQACGGDKMLKETRARDSKKQDQEKELAQRIEENSTYPCSDRRDELKKVKLEMAMLQEMLRERMETFVSLATAEPDTGDSILVSAE